MSRKQPEFQPGAILHEVIVGAFRANGTTLDQWCRANGLHPTNARQATFGQSRGEVGRAILEKMIDGAGREFVTDAYRRRLTEHFKQFDRGAA